jgi:hypothetical protein
MNKQKDLPGDHSLGQSSPVALANFAILANKVFSSLIESNKI